MRAAGKSWRTANFSPPPKLRGFEVLVTTDRNLRYQQNLAGRKIAVVVLGQGRWTAIKQHVAEVVVAISAARPGSYTDVDIPLD